MELFDKRFVYFMWDEKLKGKKVFTSDVISCLIELVNKVEDRSQVYEFLDDDDSFPFEDTSGTPWRFVYYDPNYDCKIAFAEGKNIEVRDGDNWIPATSPCWSDEYEYRIKPEESDNKRMTYRQLAEWLAKGNGQYRTERSIGANSMTSLAVYTPNENKEINYVWEIRRWNSDEWIKPTVAVYKEDICIKDCNTQ